MNISRRRFLQAGSLTFGAYGATFCSPFFFKRQLLAGSADQDKKLIYIFQRGGNDGINTVIPRGDGEYNTTNRPTLYIPEGNAIDLGNGFAQLHPAMQPMMDLYHSTGLTGQPGPGNLAILHRIGYSGQSQSHFDSQDYWENGNPGNGSLHEGMFYRHLEATMNLKAPENAFVAAGISGSQLLGLTGSHPIPNFRRADEFAFLGNEDQSAKFLGTSPGEEAGSPSGTGVRGLFSAMPSLPHAASSNLVHQTGQSLGNTLGTLRSAVARGDYTPENGAQYPDGSFGRKLQEAAMLLKRTPVKILGINIGGWDTHASQGQLDGDHPELLQDLAGGFQALHLDLQDQWENLLIVTMTEFGRTSMENGGRGTDHAEASVMFVAGGGVKGGVYNCDASTWNDGDMFSKRDRYLARRTDFRSVFGEIFMNHFGDERRLLDQIIPDYSEAAEKNPRDFSPLGFLWNQ